MGVYIGMFVERNYGGIWQRKFPKTKSQIEWLGENSVYWRGMGGGFALKIVRKDDDWVYMERHPKYMDPIMYRIARKDWDRLERKAKCQ